MVSSRSFISGFELGVEFAEWIADNFKRIKSIELNKSAWVNYKQNAILTHGSDYHFTILIKSVGLTTTELIDLFIDYKIKQQ